MFMKCAYSIIIASLLFMNSCNIFISKDRDLREYKIHEEQYQPYKLKNTIEGYREFISLYPENLFVQDAESQIENLEFAPYEEEDSVEGYMEFKMRYPTNRHVFKANVKIEQAEVKRYEKMDTIEGYKEFLSKYPDSTFVVLAQKRIQELEFREMNRTLNKQYEFDLLAYRLNLKRLKKNLKTTNGLNLADFTCFASFITYDGKKYFHTYLIYPKDLSYLDTTSIETQEQFFDPIISKALIYLENNFKNKDKINGFSFDISSSPHSYYGDRKIILEYYFPISQVNRYATHMMDKKDLLASSIIVSPKKLVQKEKEVASIKAEDSVDLEKLNGLQVMTMVSERDTGRNYIISRSWERGRHVMKAIEKRKKLRGEDGFIDKTLIRYIEPPGHYGTIILIWHYEDRERKKEFWYLDLRRELGGAPRTALIKNTERIRTRAESDFNLIDYVDINVREERHDLIRREDYNNKKCFVVESTPLNTDIKYGKRISWIDQQSFIPLKVDYWDKKGNLWKILQIEWQNKFGFLFWKNAKVENVQTNDKTFISVEDVRINVEMDDRDFTRSGLDRQRHGLLGVKSQVP